MPCNLSCVSSDVLLECRWFSDSFHRFDFKLHLTGRSGRWCGWIIRLRLGDPWWGLPDPTYFVMDPSILFRIFFSTICFGSVPGGPPQPAAVPHLLLHLHPAAVHAAQPHRPPLPPGVGRRCNPDPLLTVNLTHRRSSRKLIWGPARPPASGESPRPGWNGAA